MNNTKTAAHYLAFDTSTDLMSVALARLSEGGHILEMWEHAGEASDGAAKSSQTLLPAVDALLARAGRSVAELKGIVYGAGPGAFTGLRTAASCALGLALGAGTPLWAVSSSLCIAEEVRARYFPHIKEGNLITILDARMNEVYFASAAFSVNDRGDITWTKVNDARLIKYSELPNIFSADSNKSSHVAVVGNVPLEVLTTVKEVKTARPTAAAMLRLLPFLQQTQTAVNVKTDALPLHYVRNHVAQTTVERMSQAAWKQSS